jgi:hypothetical protein
VPVQVVPPLV